MNCKRVFNIRVICNCSSYFSGNNLDITLRHNAVQLLLVPMLTLVPSAYVLEFFKQHIVEVMEHLQKPLLRRGTDEEIKQDLIEQTSCFNLIQISFDNDHILCESETRLESF